MPSTLSLTEVWEQAQSVLQELLRKRTLAKWIPELQPRSFDGHLLSIEC